MDIESLQEKLKGYEEKMCKLSDEEEEYRSKLISLDKEKEETETMIALYRISIEREATGLDRYIKNLLKREFDIIAKLIPAYCSFDMSCELNLVFDKDMSDNYSIELSGSLRECKITIRTKFDEIADLVRKCFIQKCNCGIKPTENKMSRTTWRCTSGTFCFCSSITFEYNSNIADLLLNDT